MFLHKNNGSKLSPMLFLATEEHKYSFTMTLPQKKKTEKEYLQENLEKKKLLMF